MVETLKGQFSDYKIEQFPSLVPLVKHTDPLIQLEMALKHQTLSQHINFDKKIWKNPHSFHNERHIMATYFGIESIFGNAGTPENHPDFLPDYLNPYVQLELYNRSVMQSHLYLNHPETLTIRPEELESLMKITFLMHDTGNTQKKDGNGFANLNTYQGAGAENRSYENAEFYFSQIDHVSDEDKQRYLMFIKYITDQTIFIYDGKDVHKQNLPFGVLTRFIDVIAQGIINKDILMKQVTGLIHEQSIEEADDPVITPVNTYSFLWKYAQELVPEENYKDIIAKLLGTPLQEMPQFKSRLKKKMRRSEWVRMTERLPANQLKSFILKQ